jgi:hypothetical protein
MLLPLAAALAVLTGQTTTQLDLVGSVRLGTQLRAPYLGDNPKYVNARTPVADLTATPSLAASVERMGGRVLLSYAPTFNVRSFYDSYRRVEANQVEFLFMQWYREGRPRPYLNQSLSFGTVDWATIFVPGEVQGSAFPGGTIPGGTPGGVTPTTSSPLLSQPNFKGTLNQIYFDANGGVSWPLSKTVMLDTNGGGTYASGTDTQSIVYLPTMALARGRAQLDDMIDPIDRLSARAELTYVTFSRAPTTLSIFTEVDATARWRRQVTPTISGEAALGAGTVRGWPGGQPRPTWNVVPVAQGLASVNLATGRHAVTFDGQLGVSPFVDRFFATVYERFDTSGALVYTFRQKWQLGVRGGAGQSLQPLNGANITTFLLEGRASYVPPRIWRIDLIGGFSTAVYGFNQNPLNTWLVSLSVTFRAEGNF